VLDKQTSLRLDILRFPLILGVIVIHDGDVRSLTTKTACAGTYACFALNFTINLISNGIARVAVPLFFMMSAYLFFREGNLSNQEYGAKLKRRLRTLLIPFLFWNLATLLAVVVAQNLVATKGYLRGAYPVTSGFRPFDYLNVVIGITRSPIAFQFWFIRDLMVLVLLAPIIAFVVRSRVAVPYLVVVSALWFLDKWPLLWPSVEATLFFCVGAYIASKQGDLFTLDDRGGLLLSCFLPILLLYAAWASVESPSRGVNSVQYIQKLVILLGVAVTWWLTSRVVKIEQLKSWLTGLSGSSFFVFAAHEPLMIILRKVAFKLIPRGSEAAILGLYVSIPIILAIFLVVTYRVLKSRVPALIAVITGGRGKGQECPPPSSGVVF
jgi:surface polysaccharide O-acyltransferase-like enzyme